MPYLCLMKGLKIDKSSALVSSSCQIFDFAPAFHPYVTPFSSEVSEAV